MTFDLSPAGFCRKAAALIVLACASSVAAQPAFPGAQGFGSTTVGGRGGEVLIVDSLADDGSAGTLRWALAQSYPRIVVFRVDGIIELTGPLTIGGARGVEFAGDNPYSHLTLAGESAPGGGITLVGYPLVLQNDVHDVIIRHIRIRAPVVDETQGSIGDGIQFAGAWNVIIDHVSVSWNADEGISLESTERASNHDITVQNSLIAEGLFNGGHPSNRPHSRCMIASDGSFNISFHHNLMMSCNKRNPRAGGNSELGQADFPLVDIRHNLIYNHGVHGISFGRGAKVNIVGNIVRPGPDTPPDSTAIVMNAREEADTETYVAGNCLSHYDAEQNQDTLDCPDNQRGMVDNLFEIPIQFLDTALEAPEITPYAEQTDLYLLEETGAVPRDEIDLAFIEQYFAFEGRLGGGDLPQADFTILSPHEGLPSIDADEDGMADAWELAVGLDPSNPVDHASGFGAGGYTAIEMFLQAIEGTGGSDLNRGHSGNWYDSDQSGHGFMIEILSEQEALVYWFTYDNDGNPLWLFNVGEIEGNLIKVDLLEPSGPRFPPNFDPDQLQLEPWGTLNIALDGCSTGAAVWNVDDGSLLSNGQMPLERLTAVHGTDCEAPIAEPPARAPSDAAAYSGAWYDPAQSGHGFLVQMLSDSEALVFWFTFDTAGNPVWLHNVGSVEDARITVDLLHAAGARFPPSFDPDDVNLQPWGTLTLDFLDCDSGTASWRATMSGFSDGEMPLARLSAPEGMTCDNDAAPIEFAMQFQPEIADVGSVDSYAAFRPELPLPRHRLIYGSVFTWHGDRATKEEQTRRMVAQAAAQGIRGVVFTPTATYGEELQSRLLAGEIPPLDGLVQREWVSEDEPGFLEEMIAQRDLFAELVEEGLLDEIVLRPFQEAGSGIHDTAGLTPESYSDLLEWIVNDLYAELPVTGVIVHWNAIEGLSEAVPDLDRDILIYSGVTISMPSNGGMAAFALSQDDPSLAGRDFATRSWETAGLKTWIAEFSVWDDRRVDANTGWIATGLEEPDVIEEFFEHYRNMRRTGLLGGITWLNKNGFTSRTMQLEDVKDGRWDGPHVDPMVRDWWIDEVVPAHGYRMIWEQVDE